jgi:hypothetical protein
MVDIAELNSIILENLVEVSGITIDDIVKICGIGVVLIGYEDLTTWDEVDPSSDLTITPTTCTFTDLDRIPLTYCAGDYGLDYFGDFVIQFETQFTASEPGAVILFFAIANLLGSIEILANANDAIRVGYWNNSDETTLSLVCQRTDEVDSVLIAGGTTELLYVRMTRVGTTMNMDVFTGGFDDTLAGNASIACEGAPKRYLYAVAGRNDGNPSECSGFTKNFDIISNDYTPVFIEPFTGSNYYPLDTDFWVDEGYTDEWLIQNNKANVNQSDIKQALSRSTFILEGDFSVQLDFDSWSSSHGCLARMLILDSGDVNGMLMGIQNFGGTQQFHSNFKAGTWGVPREDVEAVNDYGKFRCRREGSTWYCDFLDGSGNWITLDVRTATTNPVWVKLHAKTYELEDSLVINYDNLQINKGSDVIYLVGDDFTGDNGDPLSPLVWNEEADSAAFEIQSNKCYGDLAADLRKNSTSRIIIKGDFDIQIDFDNWTTDPNNHLCSMRFFVLNSYIGSTDGGYIGLFSDSDEFVCDWKVSGSWEGTVETARSNSFGKLRIVRSGSNIAFSFQDGAGGWTALSDMTVSTIEMIVILQAHTTVGYTMTGNFDNFLINSPYDWDNFTGDDFTGDNGDPPDTDVWYPIYSISTGQDYDPEIQSNSLRTRVANDSGLCGLDSKYVITGDFDIQIDFTADDPSDDYTVAFFQVHEVGTASNRARIYFASRPDTGGDYFAARLEGDTAQGPTSDVTDVNPSKMRIVRSGSTVTFYYDNSGWVEIASWTWYDFDVTVRLFAANYSSDNPSTITWDNFLINSGTVVQPV